MTSKIERLWSAASNLGLASLLRLHLQKRFGRKPAFQLSSKFLHHHIIVRRDTSDLLAFHQTLVNREYSCLDNIDANLIVDLGANVGYTAAYFLSRFPHCELLAIEPDPENYAALKDNLTPYGKRCQVFHAAVWPRIEPLRFRQPVVRGNEWSRSIEASDTVDPSIGSVVTMPWLFDRAGGRRVSILKIDIEGAERELFEADTDWLKLVDNIIIELHSDSARRIFLSALSEYSFEMFNRGDLTYCLRLTPKRLRRTH
jgi:FkbM family methyltransferase